MRATPHHVLIVEDDPDTARLLAGYVRSIGMTSRIASTLEETEVALAEEQFCCVLLDKQIPFGSDSVALTSTGDAAQERIRALDPRLTADRQHVLPILIISGMTEPMSPKQQAAFIAKNMREGASSYILKPFDAETVASEILAALQRAERVAHVACEALRSTAPTPPTEHGPRTEHPVPVDELGPSAPVVHIALDGIRAGRRMTFAVNDKRRDLQDAIFVALLRVAAERARGSGGYLSAREAGITRAPEIPSRIHSTVADAVPDGFLILQRSDAGYRLHPLVTVAPIAWAAFEKDANPVIQAIAAAERKRR